MRNVATCTGIELNPIDLKKEKKIHSNKQMDYNQLHIRTHPSIADW
jgi:hypothetical protein